MTIVMIPSKMKTQRLARSQHRLGGTANHAYHAASPLFPSMPAIIADCMYPENIVPTYAAQTKIAVRLPISVFLYHDPSTYWIPTKQLPSKNPMRKRMGYNWCVLFTKVVPIVNIPHMSSRPGSSMRGGIHVSRRLAGMGPRI